MSDTKSVLAERMAASEAAEAEIDKKRPLIESRGEKRLYHVGLIEDAPRQVIDIPGVIFRGTLRGNPTSVPKRTAQVHMGPNNVLVHNEGVHHGAAAEMYDIEVEHFLKFCDEHVFRKTGEYEIAVVDPKTGKYEGGKKKLWKADIEPLDPTKAEGARFLHDETEVIAHPLSNFVWIVPTRMGGNKRPVLSGEMDPIAVARQKGEFFWDLEKAAKSKGKAENPKK